MPLAVEPAAGTVPAAGGVITHTLTNSEAGKVVFKVKSSNNNEYRLKPVFGFIDPAGTGQVEVTRLAGPPKDDKLVIQFAAAPEGATDPQEAFKGLTPAGDVTVPIKAE
ncbi:hypothetical protein PFISCL1PPCAC_24609 [Pristionchus fissidentatus]|uniref:MSP domain-containing protein n=1 Tax=Pristionchus fissidentatus TaxID=1538716 RepID=A0AAV5WU83_9BILA|nr:hypothetical protein PFISCL1PPCAC_24609 [Pristionchus fissidentatus]